MITKKEMAILKMICRGMTAKEIAMKFHRSPRTIETHIEHLKYKCGCHKKSDLIAYAFDNNMYLLE